MGGNKNASLVFALVALLWITVRLVLVICLAVVYLVLLLPALALPPLHPLLDWVSRTMKGLAEN